jgi:predicted ATP-grasp superfamily ATP-dependent carboligase
MPAIVLGLDLNGLSVVRALGRARIPGIGVDGTLSHPGRASRYCGEVVDADPCSPEELPAALREIGRSLQEPGVLFPTMDDTVRILAQIGKGLTDTLRLALPEAATVRRLMNKAELARLAEDLGWPAPVTVACRSLLEVRAAAESFPFPGVLKAGQRTPGTPVEVPQRVISFADAEALLKAYEAVSGLQPTVILQEMIPGPDSNVRFCLFYADRQSRPLALFTGRKMRQYPPRFGSTSSAEPLDDPELRRFAERFIREVAYRGIGSVEVKMDERNGRARLIEPTIGRTDFQSHLSVVNGVNIPAIAYRDLMGLPPENAVPPARPVKYIIGSRDLKSAVRTIREGEETLGGYLRSLAGRRSYALLDLADLGPWLYRIHYRTSGRALRLCRRIARGLWRRLMPGGARPGASGHES